MNDNQVGGPQHLAKSLAASYESVSSLFAAWYPG